MDKLKIVSGLIDELNKIEYPEGEQMDSLLNKTEIIMRRLYGDGNHFLVKLRRLNFKPTGTFTVSAPGDIFREKWDEGVRLFKLIMESMKHDIELFSGKNVPHLSFPKNFTLQWVKENIPAKLLFILLGFIAVAFTTGFSLGKMDFFVSIYELISPHH